jgi:hypothetical protein
MLPSILAVFKEAFPHIHIELRCALSTPTVEPNRTPAPSAPNPKFAHTERQMR